MQGSTESSSKHRLRQTLRGFTLSQLNTCLYMFGKMTANPLTPVEQEVSYRWYVD